MKQPLVVLALLLLLPAAPLDAADDPPVAGGAPDWQTARLLHPGIQLLQVRVDQPRPLVVHCVKIDLQTPRLAVCTTPRIDGWVENRSETLRQTTRDFIRSSQSTARRVILAANADAFSPWPAPWDERTPTNLLGLAISDGVLVSPAGGTPSLLIRKSGEAAIAITTADTPTQDIQTAVSGFGWCLIDGVPQPSGDDLHPRTGLGLSADGNTLFLTAIDGRRFSRQGATTRELGQWLKQFGADDGINMDGGGSTTLAWWNPAGPGDDKSELINSPVGSGLRFASELADRFYQPTERANGNNLGVYYQAEPAASGYDDPAPQRYELTKRASEIDPRAREHPEINFVFADKHGKVLDLQHAVVDTRVAPQGKLVLWLMGHNPGLFERISGYGLHGIQVHYANGWFGTLDPKARDDGVSLGRIRLEAATGEDHSPLVDIPRPDGLMERALQFVKWLAREHPQGKWEQFLSDGGAGLRWDQVILSGISHGSTTAARFAKHQRVDRVVMFSGPRDQFESWQGFPSATPSNRFFGFTHVLDGGWTGHHYCRSWELLGLNQYGPVVNVDRMPAPWQNSRRLITEGDVQNDPGRAHTAVVPGGSAVQDAAGRYIHEAVWRYLFTHPVDRTGPAVPPDPECRKNHR